jgi:hypothetical protein
MISLLICDSPAGAWGRGGRRAKRAPDFVPRLPQREKDIYDSDVHVIVTGRAQGVGYRAWAAQEAEARNLSGWVRSRRHGSVEAMFSGETIIVDGSRTADWGRAWLG